jgi:hypothetical protein
LDVAPDLKSAESQRVDGAARPGILMLISYAEVSDEQHRYGEWPSAEVPLVGAVDAGLEAAGVAERPLGGARERVGEPTLASTWYAASGAPITDGLLGWPPDVFALANLVLARAEGFRYATRVKDWPPNRFGGWAHAVEEAARRWSAWAEDRTSAVPDLVAAEWNAVRGSTRVFTLCLSARPGHRGALAKDSGSPPRD